MSRQVQHDLDTMRSFYRIRSKHSDLYLDVIGSGNDNGAGICQWPEGDYDKQRFLLVPVPSERNTYFIIVKSSGLFLDVVGSGNDIGAEVCQFTKRLDNKQKWILEPVGDDFYRIKSKQSDLYLDVVGSGNDNGAKICQFTKRDYDKQKWKLVEDGEIHLEKPSFDPPLSEKPKLTGPTRPERGDAHLVARTVLPFFMVTDPDKKTSWQLAHSPYYVLERRVFYEPVEFLCNDTDIEQSITYRETTGWEKSESKSFSVTTGISMSVSAGIYSAEVSVELGYAKSSSFTRTSEESVERPIKVPPHKSVAVWRSQSEFLLRRMDNTPVKNGTWNRSDGSYFFDQFPD